MSEEALNDFAGAASVKLAEEGEQIQNLLSCFHANMWRGWLNV